MRAPGLLVVVAVLTAAHAARAQDLDPVSERESIVALERWIAERQAEGFALTSDASGAALVAIRGRQISRDPWILRAQALIRDAAPARRARAITALVALHALAARDYRDAFALLRARLGPRFEGARATYDRHAEEWECRGYAAWARARAETHLDAELPSTMPEPRVLATRCSSRAH